MLRRGTERRLLLTAALGLWAMAVAVGMSRLSRYSGTTGLPARPAAQWPTECPLQPARRGVTLVLAMHPQCPCSAATIGELAQLMTCRMPGGERATVYALFTKSRGIEVRSATWDSASAIPGVNVIADDAGRLAAQFGAKTSGQVFAFDATGNLLFSGGITSARGHMGDSIGGDALREILSGRAPTQRDAPVFGCALAPADVDAKKTVIGAVSGSDR